MKYADLHIHTNHSDGTYTPAQVLELAYQKGLSCIGITDHDTVEAIQPAINAGKTLGVEVISGIELSAEQDDCEIHILGYFIDWQAAWFQEKLRQIRQIRLQRARAIVGKLSKQGIKLDACRLFQENSGADSIGRLHIANLMKQQHFVYSLREAFDKYLGSSCSCYVKKFKLSPAQAIDMIKQLGGVAVLAHPYCLNNQELIPELAGLGLKGLEVYYPEHDPGMTERFLKLAAEYSLLVTGGSDCHGLGKSRAMIGEVKIPYELVEDLKKQSRSLLDEK